MVCLLFILQISYILCHTIYILFGGTCISKTLFFVYFKMKKEYDRAETFLWVMN